MSDWKKRAVAATADAWKGHPATAADWESEPAVSPAETRFRANEERLAQPVPAEENPGPDVSGLNDKSKADQMIDPARYIADPKTLTGAALQHGANSITYGMGDELGGAAAALAQPSQWAREKLGLDTPKPKSAAQEDVEAAGITQPDPSLLQRVLDAYRSERDARRQDLKTGDEAHPVVSAGADLLGAMAAPAPKVAPLAKGASRLQRMLAMGKAAAPVGAAFGAGNSDADLTKGDVGGFLKDTAKGAGISGVGGALLGGVIHGPMSKLEGAEQAAKDKAASMAQEAFDRPQEKAQGALGGIIQKGHRRLENAANYIKDPDVDPMVARDLEDFIASPEGQSLKNRVAQSTAKGLPGNLSEIEGAQQALDAARAANTPENVAAKEAEILGPERFKEATMMRLKKYAGRAIPPIIGSGVGAAIGGPEGAAVGGILGGVASSVMGNPGTALANYMKDPSVAVRLAQLGQSPATLQIPQKVGASLSTDEDKRQRLLKYMESLKGD